MNGSRTKSVAKTFARLVGVCAVLMVTAWGARAEDWTPDEIETVLWLDAADVTSLVTSGDDVTRIDDKSGNGYNYNRSGDPKTGIDTINGNNVITMTGDGFGASANEVPALGMNVTWFLVLDPTGATQDKVWMSGPYHTGPNNEIGGGNPANNIKLYTVDAGDTRHVADSGLKLDSAPTMFDIERNLADDLVYFNKNGGASSTSAALGAADLMPQGGETAQLAMYYGSNRWTGKFCELVIVNGILSLDDKERMQGYLAWKWGLEGSLPAGHPYKTSRPFLLWSPAEITTELWLDASDYSTITESGGSVDQWDDKSGNDRHVSQGTNPKKPTYSATGFDGGTKPSIAFDGGDTLNRSSITGTAAGEWSVFAVIDDQSVDGYDYLFTTFGTTEQRFMLGTGGPQYNNQADGNADAGATFVAGEQQVAYEATTDARVWRDGTQIAGAAYTYTATDANGNWAVGSRGGSDYMVGDICELIFLPGKATAETRQRIEGYLAWKWGLEADLPSGHPYETFAPGGGACATLVTGADGRTFAVINSTAFDAPDTAEYTHAGFSGTETGRTDRWLGDRSFGDGDAGTWGTWHFRDLANGTYDVYNSFHGQGNVGTADYTGTDGFAPISLDQGPGPASYAGTLGTVTLNDGSNDVVFVNMGQVTVADGTFDLTMTDTAIGGPFIYDDASAIVPAYGEGGTGTLEFSAANYSVLEGNSGSKTVTVTVNRTGGSMGELTVEYVANDGAAPDPASPGVDFQGILATTMTFPDGNSDPQTFDVTVYGDTAVENDEYIQLTLQNVSGAPLGLDSATITITTDDIEVSDWTPAATTTMLWLDAADASTITATGTAMAGQLGVLDTAANAGLNPRTGSSWAVGDTYRLVFVSSTRRDATSGVIADYNAHVQDAAVNSTITSLGSVNWYAMASTLSVDAVDNTGTTGSEANGAFFKMDGSTVVADNIAEFWCGSHQAAINLTERAETALSHDGAWGTWAGTWTGSGNDGRKTNYLGGISDPTAGLANFSGGEWMSRGTSVKTNLAYIYGMSEPLTVKQIPTGTVSEWRDKSGNNNHATQPSGANQPTYSSDAISGSASLTLDLPADIYSGLTQGTVVLVGKQTSGDAGWGKYSDQAAAVHTPHGGGFYDSFLSNQRPNIGDYANILDTQVVYSCVNDGSVFNAYLNGGLLGGGGDSVGTFDTTMTNHQLFNYGNYTLYEVVMLPDDRDRQKVEGYLAWKWGLQASLDASHPYKSAPPVLGWSPDQITTELWLDAADATTITQSGGLVSEWRDKSGNDSHAAQGSSSNQPTTGSVALNGLNTIDFDGSSDDMDIAALTFGGEHTIYAVGYCESNGYRGVLRGAEFGNDEDIFFGNGNGNQNFCTFYGNGTSWDDAATNTPALSVATATIMGVVADGAGNAIPYHDGTAQDAKVCSMPSRTGFSLGSSNGGQFWDGPMGEVAI